jgi:hypothetical protein
VRVSLCMIVPSSEQECSQSVARCPALGKKDPWAQTNWHCKSGAKLVLTGDVPVGHSSKQSLMENANELSGGSRSGAGHTDSHRPAEALPQYPKPRASRQEVTHFGVVEELALKQPEQLWLPVALQAAKGVPVAFATVTLQLVLLFATALWFAAASKLRNCPAGQSSLHERDSASAALPAGHSTKQDDWVGCNSVLFPHSWIHLPAVTFPMNPRAAKAQCATHRCGPKALSAGSWKKPALHGCAGDASNRRGCPGSAGWWWSWGLRRRPIPLNADRSTSAIADGRVVVHSICALSSVVSTSSEESSSRTGRSFANTTAASPSTGSEAVEERPDWLRKRGIAPAQAAIAATVPAIPFSSALPTRAILQNPARISCSGLGIMADSLCSQRLINVLP